MAKQKIMEVPLSKLYLDNENPRHDPIDNEAEIISALVRKERVAALAKDIAKWGLSPLDRIAVRAKEGVSGSYVALEGNRRICALKLLRDPDKAPTAVLRRQFSSLADSMPRVPAKVEVVLFDEDAVSRHWMGIRHEGELGGAGTRKWNASQKARFNKSATNPNTQALRLVEYAVKRGLITPEEQQQIALTTITRYVSTPVMRDAIGLASAREFQINVPQDQFDKAVGAFLKDALPRADKKDALVNSRTDAKAREIYASTLRQRGVAATTKLPVAAAPKPTARKGPGRNNPSPDHRPHVVPADFKAVIKSNVLKRLFDELRAIDPRQFSFATAYLLRAFMEKLAHQYAVDHGLSTNGDLHIVISRCEQHLAKDPALIAAAGNPQKLERTLKPLRVMAGVKDSGLSPDTLGNWVHGGAVPTDVQLKKFWETMADCIRLLLDGLKK